MENRDAAGCCGADDWLPLYVSLQAIHVDGAVVLVLVLPLVLGSVGVPLPLLRPYPLLQLHQTSHVRAPRSAGRGLVPTVLLVRHLLDADHGLGLADQRYLKGVEEGINP